MAELRVAFPQKGEKKGPDYSFQLHLAGPKVWKIYANPLHT